MPRLILIGGPSGSGKSHLAKGVARSLASEGCTLLALDHYYRDLAHLPEAEREVWNFDHPDALDWALLLEHVYALLAGQSVERPEYDFLTHTRRPSTAVLLPEPILILEGLLALVHDTLLDSAAVRVYVDAPRSVCLDRRLLRDTSERGRTEASIRQQFRESVWPMAERHVLPARTRADLVVGGDLPLDDGVAKVVRELRQLPRP